MGFAKSRSTIPGPATILQPGSGQVGLTINSASGVAGIVVNSPTASDFAAIQLKRAGSGSGFIGTAGAANDIITGAVTGDLCARSETANVLLSANSGANIHIKIANNGNCTAPVSKIQAAATSVFTGLNFDAASDATFTSNAALANDAMVVTVNETGTYEIECFLAFFEATASTGGFQFDFGQGTATISAILFGTDAVGTAVIGLAAATSATTAQSFATIATSASAPSWSLTKGKVTFSGTGTFGLRTAQASSSVNTTTRKALSYLKLTKTG